MGLCLFEAKQVSFVYAVAASHKALSAPHWTEDYI